MSSNDSDSSFDGQDFEVISMKDFEKCDQSKNFENQADEALNELKVDGVLKEANAEKDLKALEIDEKPKEADVNSELGEESRNVGSEECAKSTVDSPCDEGDSGTKPDAKSLVCDNDGDQYVSSSDGESNCNTPSRSCDADDDIGSSDDDDDDDDDDDVKEGPLQLEIPRGIKVVDRKAFCMRMFHMVNTEWPIEDDYEEFVAVGAELDQARNAGHRNVNDKLNSSDRLTIREEIAGSVSNTWIERMKKLVANGDIDKIEFISQGSASSSQPKATQYHNPMPPMEWREFERIARRTQESNPIGGWDASYTPSFYPAMYPPPNNPMPLPAHVSYGDRRVSERLANYANLPIPINPANIPLPPDLSESVASTSAAHRWTNPMTPPQSKEPHTPSNKPVPPKQSVQPKEPESVASTSAAGRKYDAPTWSNPATSSKQTQTNAPHTPSNRSVRPKQSVRSKEPVIVPSKTPVGRWRQSTTRSSDDASIGITWYLAQALLHEAELEDAKMENEKRGIISAYRERNGPFYCGNEHLPELSFDDFNPTDLPAPSLYSQLKKYASCVRCCCITNPKIPRQDCCARCRKCGEHFEEPFNTEEEGIFCPCGDNIKMDKWSARYRNTQV